MAMVNVQVPPRAFVRGPRLRVTNEWRPAPIVVLSCDPEAGDVLVAPLPVRGGMHVVLYNKSPFPVEVRLEIPDA